MLTSLLLVTASWLGSFGFAAATSAMSASSPAKWSATVCRSLSRWQADLVKLGATPTPSDPRAAKTAVTKYLAAAERATGRLVRFLRAAGTPTLKHGKAIAAAFDAAAAKARDLFTQAARDAARLPTTDPGAFAAGTRTIAAHLGEAQATLDATIARLVTQYEPTLGAAFAHTRACRALV